MVAVPLIALGYLLGSIPFAYLTGRLIKGIDLREYGSHNLGGSNVAQHVSLWAIVPVALADIAKSTLPTWLGLRSGLGLAVALLAGLAAIIGHNWSVYLHFRGGRGLGSMFGVLLVVFPLASAYLLMCVGLGKLLRYTALGALLSVATVPLLTSVTGQPSVTIWACVGMLLIVIAKRLEANREPIASDADRRGVYVNRLLLDRDIRDREAWIRRVPEP
jgi:glycerol-3-phosphate acyltransferase PlsY